MNRRMTPVVTGERVRSVATDLVAALLLMVLNVVSWY
jgi:hypothetical protein